MDLELRKWDDGTTRFTYWDLIGGNDVVYILCKSGQVLIINYDEEGKETQGPINLTLSLWQLAEPVGDAVNGGKRSGRWRDTL